MFPGESLGRVKANIQSCQEEEEEDDGCISKFNDAVR
jgi:hypothetical protein